MYLAAGPSTDVGLVGGSIEIVGTAALVSGSSSSSTSGGIVIESPDVTSFASSGPSGSIEMNTGDANQASGSGKCIN